MVIISKKMCVCMALFFMLLIPIVFSAQTIQVATEQPAQKKSFFDTYFWFLKEPIFWYIVVGFLLILAVIIGLVFLIRWLIGFLKLRNDIFYMLQKERIKMAKIQRRYPSKSWWKVTKNTPIRIVKKDEKGQLFVSNPIAHHRGDYTSSEGNVVISMNLVGDKKYWFFPNTTLLIIPDKEKAVIQARDNKGKMEEIEIKNLPRAKDIIQFNENEILIFAESISNSGMFYVPVLKASDGKIIDLTLPVYQSLRDIVMEDFLYSQTDEFTKIAKKTMDLNPHLRFEVKAGDSNQSTEIPQNQHR
jgi:hypothetical protein